MSNQARQLGAQLIITHHPVIFHPLKRVNEDAVVYLLIRSDIAVISAHTNLDIAQGGVNDALASAIGLRDCRGLELLNEQTGRLAWPASARCRSCSPPKRLPPTSNPVSTPPASNFLPRRE